MIRPAVALLALADLAGLGLGVYARFFRELPPPPDGPAFVDDHKPLPQSDDFETFARTDPVAMLGKCLARYQRETNGGFTATLVKRERVEGKPRPPEEPPEEVIAVAVRGEMVDPATGKPCVEALMKWRSGARKFLGAEIRGALYSEKPGKEGTGGQVVTWRPDSLIKTSAVPIASSLAQGQSRYCVRDAGIYRGMLRTYDVWKQRKDAGTLRTEFVGKKAVPEVGGRVCLVVDRVCDSPEVDPFELGGAPKPTDKKTLENEGFTRVRIMIDAETWLQVGTELYRPDGLLLAAYYFRDPNPRPAFDPDTFTDAGLKR